MVQPRWWNCWSCGTRTTTSSQSPLPDKFSILYLPIRILLVGWWIYAAIEIEKVRRQVRMTDGFKQIEHGLDMYNAIQLAYPTAIVYVFWSLISTYSPLYTSKMRSILWMAVPEIFLMTFLAVSIALQAKSLPNGLTNCVNTASSPIFQAITTALPWICDTHQVGDDSYKTCTLTNTTDMTCGYFKLNWRVTIVCLAFSAFNFFVSLWALLSHPVLDKATGYVVASLRLTWRILYRPIRQEVARLQYRSHRKKLEQSGASGHTARPKPMRKTPTEAVRQKHRISQVQDRLSLPVRPPQIAKLPEIVKEDGIWSSHFDDHSGVEMRELKFPARKSPLEHFFQIDDMFLMMTQVMHSNDLQQLALVSGSLSDMFQYHRQENANLLSRTLCEGHARSGSECWACGLAACTMCNSMQRTERIPADDAEHQADHIEALCTKCYFKALNPALEHNPDELARAWGQSRPSPPCDLPASGFEKMFQHMPRPHRWAARCRPVQTAPEDPRARALGNYSRYCYCTSRGIERTLCACCRESYDTALERYGEYRDAAWDELRQKRRDRLAVAVAQGKTPSSRTGENQDCVYCGDNLRAWWKIKWWKCDVCWEELKVKLV